MTRTQNVYTFMPFIVAIIICFDTKIRMNNTRVQLYMIRVCPIFEIECVSEFLSPITVSSRLVLSCQHWLSYLWVVTILSCLFVCLFIVCSRSTFLCCWSVDLLLFCHVFSCLFLSHFPSCFHLVSRWWFGCVGILAVVVVVSCLRNVL